MDSRPFKAWLVGTTMLTSFVVVPEAVIAENSEIALDTITVTSTKTEDKAVDTLAGSSVVTRTEVDRYQPGRLSDVLNSVPGLNVQEDSDDPASVINLRGLQDFGRVNVMIEGARQNFQRSGHGGNGQVYLEPEMIKQVDITRGPVSTIYGSGAIGGVVNFGLIDPSDFIEPDETFALAQKVTFDTNRNGFLSSSTLAAQPIEEFGVLANLVYRDDGRYKDGNGNKVDFTGREVISGLVKGKWNISPETTIDFVHLRQNFEYNTGASGVSRDTTTRDSTIVVKLRHTSEDNPLVDVSISGYHTTTDTDQQRLNGALIGNVRSFRINTFGTDVFNTSRFETGPLKHTLTYGGDIFRDEVETNDPGGNGDEFTPSGERIAYGFFIQDQIEFSNWLELIVALRYDGYSLSSPDGSVSSDDTNLAPKVTLGITPIEGVKIYGTYAEGYRAPSVTETLIEGVHPGGFAFLLFPNPNLTPETAQNLEGGINLSFDGVIREDDRFRAKANYFHNEIDDFIDSVFRSPPIGTPPFGDFQYVNIAQAEIYGFEAEALYDFGDGFVQISYTHVRGDDKTAGIPLSTIYPDKFVGTAGLRFLEDKLVVGTRLTSVASQNRVPTGTPSSRAYDLLDFFATYKHNRYFSTALTLKNVTDEQYVPFRQAEGRPSAGFTALISATVKVGG